MISIEKAGVDKNMVLSAVGSQTFLESHGHSASGTIVDNYVNEKFSAEVFASELSHSQNLYYIINWNQQTAGYSKIILNTPLEKLEKPNIAKLERIYILKEYLDKKLGYTLIKFNIDLARQQGQEGIWLHVWKENTRAFEFYKKIGFKVIGSYMFRLSPTHANPNHIMYLDFNS